jgi:thiamine transporter ThiT
MPALPTPRFTLRSALEWAVLAISITLGAIHGFDFGHQVTGGLLFGLVTAAMGALFASIVASALLDRVLRRLVDGR